MMPIDFDAEVLSVCMSTFAVPIIINPLVSQPGAPAYVANGIWTVEPYSIIQENQEALITSIFTIGLELSALPASPPMVGDVLIVNSSSYWFDSQQYDGQGGVSWKVKAFEPLQQTPPAVVRSAQIIRDAIYDRVAAVGDAWPGSPIKTVRKVGMPPLQPTDLPSVSIFTMREAAPAFGQADLMIPLNYNNTTIIGMSICRGFSDPVFLQGGIETDALFVKNLLMTDVTFAARRWPGAMFEAVESINVTQIFNQDGETYFGEIRLEIAFRFQEPFFPIVVDRLKEINIKLRGRVKPELPPFQGEIDLPQKRRDHRHGDD